MTERPVIPLSDADRLAEGNGRFVYRHPDVPGMIIKIHKPLRIKRLQGVRTWLRYNRWRYGVLLNTAVEVDEFMAMVARADRVPRFATQFRGFVTTTLGAGALFEAVLAPDGTLAPQLRSHARSHGHEPGIVAAIDALWDEVLEFRAVISDSNLTNVLVSGDANDGYRLTLVDGLGERTVIRRLTHSDGAYKRDLEARREAMKREYIASTVEHQSKS